MKKLIKFIMIFIIFSVYIYAQSQLVISYIDGGLLENKNYELKNLSLGGNLIGTNASGLDAILDYNYTSHKDFIQNGDFYEYNYTTKENYLLLPFDKNTLNTTKKGQLLLALTETINNDFVRKILIDEEYTLPADAIILKEDSGNFGNTFTYSENGTNTQEHFSEYKKQEYLIRIMYEGANKPYDIYNKANPIRLIETYENDFLNKNIDYIDFIFSGDDYGSIQEQIGAYGLSINFIPSNVVLTKENNLIKIEVMARSQYYELEDDGNTTLTNYKIQKGLFIVRGSGNELALSSDYDEIKISLFSNGWYKLEAFLDANEFEDKFANNNFYIEATATTRENSKTISLTGVEVGEFNPPLITEINLTNDSLFERLKLLKDEFGNRVFEDNEAFNLSSISYTDILGINLDELNTHFSSNKNKLAFKLGDEISYSIKVEDESIRKLNGSFIKIGDTLGSLSLFNNKYEGKAKVNTNNQFIQIHIEDDYENTSTLVNSSGNPANLPLLYRPAILGTTAFPNKLYFSSKLTESPILDRALLETNNLIEDALAYLLVFDYDIEKSDAFVYDDIPMFNSTYNILEGKVHWLVNKENKFSLLDGEYKYHKVFTLNRAMEVYTNEEFEDSLVKIKDELNALEEKTSFRVDNVAPRLVSTNYNKSLDSNNISITGLNVPIKNLDEIEFLFKVEDINLGDIILLENTSELLNLENIIDNDLDEIKSKIRILYNQANENKTLTSEFQISDLAGNILVINPSISYNSRLPSKLTTIGEVTSNNNIKFTKDINYKLNKEGLGQDIAYASIKNNFSKINSLPVSISNFNFQGIENMNNILDITTYSSSGIKLGPNMEQIVIDTKINGGSIPNVKSNSADGIKHRVPISFNKIQELVGLQGFKVNTPNIAVVGENISNGYYPLTGADYNTVAGTSTYNESYFLEFTRDIPGEYTIQVELIDRLGNKGIFNFIVQITRIVELRGKVEGSDLEIKSIIEIDEELEIKSRTK